MAHDKTALNIGPNSSARRLENIDGRRWQSKFLVEVRTELTATLGGPEHATYGQQMLVGLASVKALRLQLISEEIMSGNASLENERRFVWFSNSLRRDLMALGLDRPSKAPPQSLADFIQGHAA